MDRFHILFIVIAVGWMVIADNPLLRLGRAAEETDRMHDLCGTR